MAVCVLDDDSINVYVIVTINSAKPSLAAASPFVVVT